MINLHLTLTPFANESRLVKEAESLSTHGIFSKVHIFALWELGLDQEEAIGCIEVYRVKLRTRGLPRSLLFQIFKYLEFAFRSLLHAKTIGVHTVNVHSLALLPLGVLAKKLFRCKLVYDTHELETERNGLLGIRKKLSKWIEKRLIKEANLTIVVGEKIADYYKESYSIPRPTVVLNAPIRRCSDRPGLLRRELKIPDSTAIYLYQGMLTEGRGIDGILNGFCGGGVTGNKVAVFMGYGPLTDSIIEAAKKHTNVRYLPAVSPDVILDYTMSADFGFSLIEPVCLSYEYCLPNKLFEYILSGVTVIATDLPEMKKIIDEEECGYLVKPGDNQGLIDTINYATPCDISVNQKYTWQHQEAKMLAAYREYIL